MNVKQEKYNLTKIPLLGKDQGNINRQMNDAFRQVNNQITTIRKKLDAIEKTKSETFKYIKGNINDNRTNPNADKEINLKSSDGALKINIDENNIDLVMNNLSSISTGLTDNSVVFVSGGVFAEDNTNLVWNNTTKELFAKNIETESLEISTLINGSVLFVDSGAVAEDNTNLVWNNTTKDLTVKNIITESIELTTFTNKSILFVNGGLIDENNANLNWDNVSNELSAKNIITDNIELSTFTSESILFVDSGGNIVEDNPDFVYDSVSKELSVDYIVTSGIELITFTDKSVLYIDNSDVAEDNSSFSYDDVSKTLSVDYIDTYVLTSTVGVGTAPLSVSSTTMVTNLNAELWDGNDFSDYLNQGVRTSDYPSFLYILLTSLLAGSTQAGAGAGANEVWKTSGHATLPDNVLMIGV